MAAFTQEQLHLAAQLYWIEGLPQAEVAKLVNVSQSKVSRLLSVAREQGIVRISVADYEVRSLGIEKELKTKFKLSSAVVIKTVENLPIQIIRQSLGRFAAPVVAAMIPPRSCVAIAGGRTIGELLERLTLVHPTVIQVMGNFDSKILPIDAAELGRAFALRSDGTFLTLNCPAFVPDKKTRDAFLKLKQIRLVEQKFNAIDIALVGIGTLENSIYVDRSILSQQELNQLKKAGAVGEMCGRFFNREGKECLSPLRDRAIGIKLEHFRQIPQVVVVVAGTDRSEAICAAIRGGMLKSLVIDEAGARSLLQTLQS